MDGAGIHPSVGHTAKPLSLRNILGSCSKSCKDLISSKDTSLLRIPKFTHFCYIIYLTGVISKSILVMVYIADKTPRLKATWGENGLFHLTACSLSGREVRTET